MNIVKRIDQYDESHVIFCEPIKNNVMNDGNFIRIIYSTHNVVLNGIYLLLI
jgi:beta-lactam-binding protein with PASTA domain